MLRTNSFPVYLLLILLVLVSLGCQLVNRLPSALEALETTPTAPEGDAQAAPTAQPPVTRPTGERPYPPAPTLEVGPGGTEPTAAPAGTIPLENDPCQEETCISAGSFLLSRPIGEGGRNTIVAVDRYGSYHRATKNAQTGVYFLNSAGTPVLAAADGVVAFAGNDREVPMGPFKDLYGRVIILKHTFPELEKPLFTVYAHLSDIEVEKGDDVFTGQEIGKVGSSGSAIGSILLFEVRLGKNHFQNTRNPELWLKPLKDADGRRMGAIAGRIENKNGKAVQVGNIVLEQLAGPGMPAIDQLYLETYTGKRQSGQPPWIENFAAGDLPPGEYQISFMGDGVETQTVTVEPGKLTLVTIVVEN